MLLMCRAHALKPRWPIFFRNYIAAPNVSKAGESTLENDEYTETAEYPVIKEVSYVARKRDQALTFQKQVQNAATVEEKIIKINMPRYYGYQVVQLHDERLPYNCLPAIQFYTRTLYEEMPSELKEDEKIGHHFQSLKADVLDALEIAHDCFSQTYPNPSILEPMEKERILAQAIVEQINRVLINALSAEYQHLQDVDFDFNPRHEAFWSIGGIPPTKSSVRHKLATKWLAYLANKPNDRFMQYKSKPMLTIRHPLQLSTWKTEADYNNFEKAKQVPQIKLDPRCLGFIAEYQHGTNISGQWPNNLASFGFLSYQSRAALHIRPKKFAEEDNIEALHAHAIQSSFAWLLAQANDNGFNTYSELTYPLNTQTIITDGKTWSFYEYQLNTLLMSGSQIDKNPRVNYCRGTKEMNLYEGIDENGKVVGFNDKVLKYLLQFYTNAPSIQRSPEELQPFLNAEYKRAADYEDEEKRVFLEKIFKHLVSNRPRHLAIPEIYMWEKIYKIDNQTRPMEARRRYFELFIDPWKRTLDQHVKEYIPKYERPEGPKSKKKFKKAFYP